MRKAWKETRNEDIAARLIGHIRRAAVGDALKPFEERVDHALTRIKGRTRLEQRAIKLARSFSAGAERESGARRRCLQNRQLPPSRREGDAAKNL
ncbi:type I restriction-modification enzyme R subunit C-terminal domain-containing protein [Escherichia coli]